MFINDIPNKVVVGFKKNLTAFNTQKQGKSQLHNKKATNYPIEGVVRNYSDESIVNCLGVYRTVHRKRIK